MPQSILGSHDTAASIRNRRRGIKRNYAELRGIKPGNCRSKDTAITPLLAPFRKSRNFALLWPGAGVVHTLAPKLPRRGRWTASVAGDLDAHYNYGPKIRPMVNAHGESKAGLLSLLR